MDRHRTTSAGMRFYLMQLVLPRTGQKGLRFLLICLKFEYLTSENQSLNEIIIYHCIIQITHLDYGGPNLDTPHLLRDDARLV